MRTAIIRGKEHNEINPDCYITDFSILSLDISVPSFSFNKC